MESDSFSFSAEEYRDNLNAFGDLNKFRNVLLNEQDEPRANDPMGREIEAATTLERIRALSESTKKSSDFFFSKKVWDEDIVDFSDGLESLMLQHKSVSSYVPAAALPFFSSTVLMVMDAISRYPGTKSWSLFFALPSLLLWSRRSVSEFSRAKFVATRSNALMQGKMQWLVETMVEMAEVYSKQMREKKQVQKESDFDFDEKKFLFLCSNNRSAEALSMILEGKARRARVIGENGHLDEATTRLLNEKIPEQAVEEMESDDFEAVCSVWRDLDIAAPKFSVDDLYALYSGQTASKRRGTGGGLSGWNFDMIANCLRVPARASAVLKSYVEICGKIGSGSVPNVIAK
jgi:hypothetical protein